MKYFISFLHIVSQTFFLSYLFGCVGSQLQHAESQLWHMQSSSLTKDGAQAPCIGRAESQSLEPPGKFCNCILKIAKNQKQYRCPSTSKWLNNSTTSLQWNISQLYAIAQVNLQGNMLRKVSPKCHILYDSMSISFSK